MLFRIRSIDVTASGRELVRERAVEAEALTIGRASENHLPLPDLAVEQHHLRLVPLPGGALGARALGTLGFGLDGRMVQEGRIEPGQGAEIALGSFRLEVLPEAGAVAITLRQILADKGEAKERLKGFALAAAMPSRRVLSWIGALAVLIAFLIVPIYSHLTREPVAPDPDRPGQVLMDRYWSTGALSLAHHDLEDNCEACHTTPFVAVTDNMCLACHEETFAGRGDHARPSRLLAAMPALGQFDQWLWQVATAFNKPGRTACTSCHSEHEAAPRLGATPQQFCADCHEGMDARLTDTRLGNAGSFADLHPQFHPLVLPERGGRERRVSLDENPTDFSGLKFPHDLHLSATNGVARMAMRLDPTRRGGLECADCHEAGEDGVSFRPVNMQARCESCHSLVIARTAAGGFRSLTHGNIARMQAELASLARLPRHPVASGRRRPGEFAEGGRYYSNFGAPLPVGLTRASLEEGGQCGECHYPARTASGGLAVAEVRQTARYFQHGWFTHAAHEDVECSTCHEAEASRRAEDLLIPGIAVCRDCHLAEGAAVNEERGEIASSCAMCHSYHPRAGAPWRPAEGSVARAVPLIASRAR